MSKKDRNRQFLPSVSRSGLKLAQSWVQSKRKAMGSKFKAIDIVSESKRSVSEALNCSSHRNYRCCCTETAPLHLNQSGPEARLILLPELRCDCLFHSAMNYRSLGSK